MGKKNKNKRSNKQKVQKRINKWMSDGKITGKEAKKATKQGISLARIQKARTKSFKSGNPFSRDSSLTISSLLNRVSRTGGVGARGAQAQGRGTGQYRGAPNSAPMATPYSPLIYKKEATDIFQNGLPKQEGPAQDTEQAPVGNDAPIMIPEEIEEPEFGLQDPFGLNQDAVTIGNPRKKRRRGGLAQFGGGGKNKLSTIKSKLLNV